VITTVTRFASAVATLAAGVAVAVAATQAQDPLIVLAGVWAVCALSVTIVGTAGVRSAPRHPVAWILLVAGTFLPVAIAGFVYARAVYEHGADLPGARVAGWLDGWPWVPGLCLVPTVGLMLFPDGRLPTPRWRWPARASVALAVVLGLSILLGAHLLDYPDRANPTGLPGAAGDVANGLGALTALMAPLATLGALSLRSRPADPVVRMVRPAAWLMAASWWSCIAIGAAGGETVDAIPAEGVGILALGVTCWVAVRRYRLFDARLAVRRGLVYAGLSACVLAVYLAVAAIVRAVVADDVAPAVAVLTAVLVALPLRDGLQRAANRLVYGLRDDPYEALVALGRRLEDVAAADDVLPAVASTIRDALRVPSARIAIGDEDRNGASEEAFPLVFAGETVGALRVGRRDEPFTASERRLLEGIAAQVAAVAHAVALTADLRRSRERVVTASAEERRRVRRDLHDGLGPLLAGIVLGLQRTRGRVDDRAARELDDLTEQTQNAIAEVRRLVHDLRPPALDELGLVGALTEQGRVLGDFEVAGPDPQPPLPAAVEVAAYRITLEAMTNVARHAGARQARVRIDIGDAVLIEVSDDGDGLPTAPRAGVGIASMRERALELGGVCTVEPAQPRGTVVRASIPLVSA
jgi:two-component system, NarL family, sensor kinase